VAEVSPGFGAVIIFRSFGPEQRDLLADISARAETVAAVSALVVLGDATWTEDPDTPIALAADSDRVSRDLTRLLHEVDEP
jgi:hypothetical protein